jgi:superoxide dismutase, Cu-Zn family
MRNPLKSRRVLLAAATAAVPMAVVGVVLGTATSQAAEFVANADLKAADGTDLGMVVFTAWDNRTVVSVHLRVPGKVTTLDAFHGFHIHANDKPENGVGCVADPAKPADTWFLSADGHLAEVSQIHGGHKGDMPSLLVNGDGSSDVTFTTGRMTLADLNNRVVVVHAKADNFGNVPVGTATDQYQPNSPEATTKTAATGNASDRVGCGVVTAY